MFYKELSDVKEQNPLILDNDYKTMDIIVLEEVKRGDVIFVNSDIAGTKIESGNKLFGIVLDDMVANGITAILVSGKVNYDEVKHADAKTIAVELRKLGIYLKKGV